MKKLICLFLVLTFCACFALPAFAADDGGFAPSPTTPPAACEHTSTSIVGQKDATCTSEGYTGDEVCDNCSEVLTEGEVIPVLEHSFVDGVCENCGAEEESDGFNFWWIILIILLIGGATGGYYGYRKKFLK